jgi:hypothetical protein
VVVVLTRGRLDAVGPTVLGDLEWMVVVRGREEEGARLGKVHVVVVVVVVGWGWDRHAAWVLDTTVLEG